MTIVIDGYNFLDGAGILALGPEKYSLAMSRQAILRVLRAKLTDAECETTTVVFDGTEAPPGLIRREVRFGITVLYSAIGEQADDLIEHLVETHTHPRRLTVVSSDHRIQRAARRRRAKAVDSDVWYRGLLERSPEDKATSTSGKVADRESPDAEVASWMKAFGDIDVAKLEAEVQRNKPSDDAPSAPTTSDGKTTPGEQDSDDGQTENAPSQFPEGYGEDVLEEFDGSYNPFPEGYGEDLL